MVQVREGAAAAGVLLGGENALPCFVPGGVDQYALDRIVYNTQPWSPPLQVSHMLVPICNGFIACTWKLQEHTMHKGGQAGAC